MIARSAAARAAASVVLAGALILGTTGCTFISQQATLIQYDPSDGVGTDVGNVQVRNAIALISEDGRAVSIMITMLNSGKRTANVNLQYQSGGEKTTTLKSVNPGKVAAYGTKPDGPQIIVLNPGVEAGQLFPVYIQYGDNEGKELLLPVLNADAHPEYDGLFPPEIER
ncbi:hypothetical protein BH09ACT5_BH09ACT5_03050 [soil metagenome]